MYPKINWRDLAKFITLYCYRGHHNSYFLLNVQLLTSEEQREQQQHNTCVLLIGLGLAPVTFQWQPSFLESIVENFTRTHKKRIRHKCELNSLRHRLYLVVITPMKCALDDLKKKKIHDLFLWMLRVDFMIKAPRANSLKNKAPELRSVKARPHRKTNRILPLPRTP